MKVFESKPKNLVYLFYRLINPIFDPIKFLQGIYGYFWYIRDLINYKIKDPKAIISISNLFPILNEKTQYTTFDAHYFYHPIWAFDRIVKNKPQEHVDVASDHKLSGYLSLFMKTTFIDIRPIKTSLKNLYPRSGDVLNLPYKNNSVASLSCLHVVEHIGLGRYGDPIDPKGTEKACKELSRVLAKNGFLYFCLPVGKSKICFNAHRIHTPETIISYFNGLKLLEFSLVDDNGIFHKNCDPKKFNQLDYGCGMFIFTKLI